MNHEKNLPSLALLVSLLSSLPVYAEAKISEETRKKTALALEWLAKQQNEDGSFSDGGYVHNTGHHRPSPCWRSCRRAICPTRASMARSSQGRQASSWPPSVADGYIVGARGGNMYCHGMATLALSELWGQTGSDEIKPWSQKAVELIWAASRTREAGAIIRRTTPAPTFPSRSCRSWPCVPPRTPACT